MSRTLIVPAAVLCLLAGCISPYRMAVPQGNVVTRDMMEQLRPGMTRNEVRYVLGTPLVTDPFHPDRWDYFYSLRKGAEAKWGRHTESALETKHLTVIFEKDRVLRIESDYPTGESDASTPKSSRDETVKEPAPVSRLL